MIVLIDNYDSFTFNLWHYLGELGADVVVHRNDQVSVEDVLALKPQAIVISPGPGTPERAGIIMELIGQAAGTVPIFGVCLGMQAMGAVFGGQVIRSPKQMHGKTSTIHHVNTGIFANVPQDFTATRYHSLIVDRATLPDCLVETAAADGLIMGLSHRELPIHGVQFHPESIASEHGHLILKNFLDLAGARP